MLPLQCRLHLYLRSDFWPRNSICHRVAKNEKKKERERERDVILYREWSDKQEEKETWGKNKSQKSNRINRNLRRKRCHLEAMSGN